MQAEQGYVSPEGVAFCAENLGITKAQVGAVATFYTMYKRKPTGEYLVSVCTNTMCGVLGGNRTFEALSEHLGVGHDETTADGTITLEHAECLAACDYAPVVTVNYDFFDQIQADEALSIIHQLEEGQRPQPSRGARLCTLKELSLQLAGYPDARKGAVAEGPAGEPTVRGNRLAEQYGIAVPRLRPGHPDPDPRRKPDRAPARRQTGAVTAATHGRRRPPGEPAPRWRRPGDRPILRGAGHAYAGAHQAVVVAGCLEA